MDTMPIPDPHAQQLVEDGQVNISMVKIQMFGNLDSADPELVVMGNFHWPTTVDVQIFQDIILLSSNQTRVQ